MTNNEKSKPKRGTYTWTEAQIKDIIGKYQKEHLSARKIAEIYDVKCHSQILKVLKNSGTSRRPKNKRNSINEDYFEVIDTEEKAYLLGFLFADGCIHDKDSMREGVSWQKNVKLDLQQRDIEIIELLKNAVGSRSKISIHEGRCMARMAITSDKMCNDLISLGCTPRKSSTLEFPHNKFDIIWMPHFIRGLFDGDGCICSHTSKTGNTSFSFDICGTEHLCFGVKKYLSDVVVLEDKDKQPYYQKPLYRMYYRRNQSIMNIYHYLYDDATHFLKRKEAKFRSIFEVKK